MHVDRDPHVVSLDLVDPGGHPQQLPIPLLFTCHLVLRLDEAKQGPGGDGLPLQLGQSRRIARDGPGLQHLHGAVAPAAEDGGILEFHASPL
ncbi:hypothetical protein D3C84_506750 [compost metagenome]